MQKAIPRTTLLRFPLLFGGFIGAIAVAFVYRRTLLGDLEDEKLALFKEDMEGKKMIEDFKLQYGKKS